VRTAVRSLGCGGATEDLRTVYERIGRLQEAGADVPLTWGRIESAPGEPSFFGYRVRLGDSGIGNGWDAHSPIPALSRAIGEAVERLVWFERPPSPDRLRVDSVAGVGRDGLSLRALAGYSPELRARHSRALSWDRGTVFTWIAGRSLLDGNFRWVPLQIVTGLDEDKYPVDVSAEPELRPRVTTGVAAHRDRTAALLNAIYEVIERDALMITWLSGVPPSMIDFEAVADVGLAEAIVRLRGAGLVPRAFLLKSDAPASTVVAAIQSRDRAPALAFGSSAHHSPVTAVSHALLEAFVTWRYIKRLRAKGTVAPADPVALDRDGRLLWWAEPDRWKELEWFLSPDAVADINPIRFERPDDALERFINWLRETQEETVSVDLTDDASVDQLGHHVVAAVIPGFHPMHLQEARPALWSHRLGNRPIGTLNLRPHPFA